jgi:enoyl-CoA hydratase/carnithine racemase
MSELVQLTKIDGIEVVTINNPPVNALSSAVASGIAVAVAQIGYGFPAYRGGPCCTPT